MNSNNPPDMNPNDIVTHGIIFRDSHVSIAGDKSEKNEAAIITPAANPSMASIIVLFIFLKKKTKLAPSAVRK